MHPLESRKKLRDVAAPKGFWTGTHRVVAPAGTVARVRALMPDLGITRVANVTGLDCVGLPVVMVYRPYSCSLSVFQGKGLDLDCARASGLMEAMETFHAEHLTLPLKLASFNELRPAHEIVDVSALPHSSVSVFHPDRRLLWVEGRELRRGTPTWVPHELVHLNYTLPLPAGSGCFLMSSNGLASGNHPLEAISHGLCELVERDATTLWHALDEGARSETRIDLRTVDEPDCRDVLARYERAGLEVAIWQTTTDIGIPSFLCMAIEREPDPLRPIPPAQGMGCHPARHIALLRALTETAQCRLTAISGARDDLMPSDYEAARDADAMRQLLTWMRRGEPGQGFHDVPTHEAETIDEDVSWELEQLEAAGLTQVVVVDLTKPEFGLPVVRVVVPGLEAPHELPGYIPGLRARRRLEHHA